MSAAVKPFTSTYYGTLDAKGRVCIPASFRERLAALGTDGLYLWPTLGEASLAGFGYDVIEKFHAAQADADPIFGRKQNARARAFLGKLVHLPRDENGRVRLPEDLIKHAGLKDQVAFVGLGEKFQIWDAARFAADEEARHEADLLLYDDTGMPGTGGGA